MVLFLFFALDAYGYSQSEDLVKSVYQSRNFDFSVEETHWLQSITLRDVNINSQQKNMTVHFENTDVFFEATVHVSGEQLQKLDIKTKPVLGFEFAFEIREKIQKFELSHTALKNWRILYSESLFLGNPEDRIALNYRLQF